MWLHRHISCPEYSIARMLWIVCVGRVAPLNGLSDHPRTCEQKNNEEESYINVLGYVVDISCLLSNYQPLPSPPPIFFHNSKNYELLSNSFSVTACYPGRLLMSVVFSPYPGSWHMF